MWKMLLGLGVKIAMDKHINKEKAIDDLLLLVAKKNKQIRELEAKKEELRGALLQHREDLHGYSKRPCPTCRRSAAALDIKVPDQCARVDWDKQALKG